MNYEIDPATKKALNWTIAIIILVFVALYFIASDWAKHNNIESSSSTSNSTILLTPYSSGNDQCRGGHWEVQKPLSGGYVMVCESP